jgi:hypothetical protein
MTTAILSRFGFGVADTQATQADMPLPTIARKIFIINDPETNLPQTLITASGLGGFEQRCLPLKQPLDKTCHPSLHPAATPESTIEWLAEYQYDKRNDDAEKRTLLVTNTRRQLILIDSAGTFNEITAPFWAIGSGQPWSLGYLQGLRETLSDEKSRASISSKRSAMPHTMIRGLARIRLR